MKDFLAACARGDLSGVTAAVESGADVNYVGSAGVSGLMSAVHGSHVCVVQFLLQQPGIDVSRKGRRGGTALYSAVAWNSPTLLYLLLAHPTADPTGRNDEGRTPLDYCRSLIGS